MKIRKHNFQNFGNLKFLAWDKNGNFVEQLIFLILQKRVE